MTKKSFSQIKRTNEKVTANPHRKKPTTISDGK